MKLQSYFSGGGILLQTAKTGFHVAMSIRHEDYEGILKDDLWIYEGPVLRVLATI